MNRFRQRQTEAAERRAERRRREDEAPRLTTQVPKLESLVFEIEENRSGTVILESTHIKRIPVEHAPALFELPCQDSFCKDGGHDVTQAVLRSLQTGATTFTGEHSCSGHTGTAECQRVLRYVAKATYKP